MKNQKLRFENFTTKALSRNQKITIFGKGGATTLPEIDENGNIINNVTESGPIGGNSAGPGGVIITTAGDVKLNDPKP